LDKDVIIQIDAPITVNILWDFILSIDNSKLQGMDVFLNMAVPTAALPSALCTPSSSPQVTYMTLEVRVTKDICKFVNLIMTVLI